jgi:hypothetical protein
MIELNRKLSKKEQHLHFKGMKISEYYKEYSRQDNGDIILGKIPPGIAKLWIKSSEIYQILNTHQRAFREDGSIMNKGSVLIDSSFNIWIYHHDGTYFLTKPSRAFFPTEGQG